MQIERGKTAAEQNIRGDVASFPADRGAHVESDSLLFSRAEKRSRNE
jgi:hypothetical protein